MSRNNILVFGDIVNIKAEVNSGKIVVSMNSNSEIKKKREEKDKSEEQILIEEHPVTPVKTSEPQKIKIVNPSASEVLIDINGYPGNPYKNNGETTKVIENLPLLEVPKEEVINTPYVPDGEIEVEEPLEAEPKETPTTGAKITGKVFDDTVETFSNYLNEKMGEGITPDGAVYKYLEAAFEFMNANKATYQGWNLYTPIFNESNTSTFENTDYVMFSWFCSMLLAEIYDKIAGNLYKVGFSDVGAQRVHGWTVASNPQLARITASIMYSQFRIQNQKLYRAALKENQKGLNFSEHPGGFRENFNVSTFKNYGKIPYANPELFMPITPKNDSSNPDYAWDLQIAENLRTWTTTSGDHIAETKLAAADNDYKVDSRLKLIFGTELNCNISDFEWKLIDNDPEDKDPDHCYYVLRWGTTATGFLKDGYDSLTGTTLWSSHPNTSQYAREFRPRPCHILDNYPTFNGEDAKKIASPSYPSGHSGCMWNVGLVLMSLHPEKCQQIAKRAFQYCQHRTIARYHWYSDIIYGAIVGSTCLPVLMQYKGWLKNYLNIF